MRAKATATIAELRELLADPHLPVKQRLVLLGTVAYLLNPIDLIPDFIPVSATSTTWSSWRSCCAGSRGLGHPLGPDRRQLVGEAVPAMAQPGDLEAHRPEVLELLDVEAARVAAVDEVGERRAGPLEVICALFELEALGLDPWAPDFHVRDVTCRSSRCHGRERGDRA